GVVKEKSWLGRLSNWVSNNILGFGKQTSEQPYGSFYPPKSSTPEYWSKPGPNDRKDAPLYVYSGGSFDFGPSAGTPWSVPVGSAITPQAPGRVCVSSTNSSILGKECKTSSDCQGGVCSGVGKFCYNQQGISNGTACKGSGDCPNPNDFTCSYPKETEESPFATTPGVAIDRLQQLFAKVYGVWKWSNADGKYELCDAYENGSINCNLGDDFTADISGTGRDNSASVDDVTVLGGNILAVPGGKVELNFTVNGSADQLPLDGIWIDWQDGNVEYFKGPFGYKPNLALPYKAYHVYTCYTNEQGNQCVACTNSPAVNGQCDYGTPLVNVKNHWGWCSNTGPFRGQGQVSQWVDEADCDPANGTPADKSVIIE
ncbi:MAG: hypothetical protein Q8P32_03820, partial [Candidatus Komeilibacteria bacterium]|nr:hypothetical protein [Candidatus Komeilibacteria bacterium]